MAGVYVTASTPGDVTLSAATAKTVLRVASPTNGSLRILGWAVYFEGTSSSAEPANIRAVKGPSSGTGTSVSGDNLFITAGPAITLQSACTYNFTVEPTKTGVYDLQKIHPQNFYEQRYTPGQEPIVSGGDRFGIECTAAAGVDVRAKIFYEE